MRPRPRRWVVRPRRDPRALPKRLYGVLAMNRLKTTARESKPMNQRKRNSTVTTPNSRQSLHPCTTVAVIIFAAGITACGSTDDITFVDRTNGQIEQGTIRGEYDYVDIACVEESHPKHFAKGHAVAKTLFDGGGACTAWRLGAGNYMVTNWHCLPDQAKLDEAQFWFNYQQSTCGGVVAEEVVVNGGELISSNRLLDYALFTVEDFASIESFGHFGLELQSSNIGDRIYIPQHPYGSQKKIAIESDIDASGFCEVGDLNQKWHIEGELGYLCDTAGGGSGSPVVSDENHRVIALHHAGSGDFSKGIKIAHVWAEIAGFFDGVVPGYESEPPEENIPPTALFAYACDGATCQFSAQHSADADGDLVGYVWDFGDGNMAVDSEVTHTYQDAGEMEVVLKVVDNLGAVSSVTRNVPIAMVFTP